MLVFTYKENKETKQIEVELWNKVNYMFKTWLSVQQFHDILEVALLTDIKIQPLHESDITEHVKERFEYFDVDIELI